MQNLLYEVVTGKKDGVVVDAMMLDSTNKEVSLSKFKFKHNEFLGCKLSVFQNIPKDHTIVVTVIKQGDPSAKTYYFTIDLEAPFNVYKLDDKIDCFIVSGKFKPTHSCKLLKDSLS
jgi:hypothetical protein